MKWIVIIATAAALTACTKETPDSAPEITYISMSNELNFTQSGDLFTDTVMVTSNTKWEIANLPIWIKSYEMLDNIENENTNVSAMRLLFTADNEKFTPQGLSEDVILRTAGGKTYNLPAKFAGFKPYISFNVSQIQLAIDPIDSNYYGKVIVNSNVDWEILHQCPWCRSITEIAVNRGNGIESMGAVTVGFERNHHDSPTMDGRMIFSDSQTGVSSQIDVMFPKGTDHSDH